MGANYVEANENLGKADLKMRIKISRKEGKESIQWLKLLHVDSSNTLLEAERLKLVDEAEQLRKIFSAISIKLDQ